jgi:hypothetical protein
MFLNFQRKKENIFKQGNALLNNVKPTLKVLVVRNYANTNTSIVLIYVQKLKLFNFNMKNNSCGIFVSLKTLSFTFEKTKID